MRESAPAGSTPASRVFEPIVRNRPCRATGDVFKIVALNARGGVGFDRIAARLDRPPLAGADAILLCEMDWRLGRSGGMEVPAELARRRAMSFAFQPKIGFGRSEGRMTSFFGIAILSVVPFQKVTAIPMPIGNPARAGRLQKPARGYRSELAPSGLAVEIKPGGRRLTLGVVHLDSRADPAGREREMAAYLAGLPGTGPAVIGGDLNTTTVDLDDLWAALPKLALEMVREPRRLRCPERHEPLFARMRQAGFIIDAANIRFKPTFTFSRFWPPMLRPKLDWLAAREIEPVMGSAAVVPSRRHILDARASDHDFIVCDFRI